MTLTCSWNGYVIVTASCAMGMQRASDCAVGTVGPGVCVGVGGL